MKKFLHSVLFLASLLASAAEVSAATIATATGPHRQVFGFFQNNLLLQGYGISSFYMDTPKQATLLKAYDYVAGMYAGATVDGMFYGVEYKYATTGPTLSQFISYDTYSGKYTVLGTYDSDMAQMRFQDMTYDYTTNTMYLLGFNSGAKLYTVDLTTGAITQKLELSKSLGTLACDKEGQLWAIDQSGYLCKVDKEKGTITQYQDLGLAGMGVLQSMDFDRSTGILYWASDTYGLDNAVETHLIAIDVNQSPATVTDLGVLGSQANLIGMYIPYAEGGVDAPAAVSDLAITAGTDNARSATLSWTNPSTTLEGDALSELTSIVVTREGEVVKTFSSPTAGEKMSFEDTGITEDKTYKYSVYATNSKGDGQKTYVYSYIGYDSPEAVPSYTMTVGAQAASATLSWTAPTKGLHGSTFDPASVTYDILRLPDNVYVAKDLTETTFEDKSFTKLALYAYDIIAKNAQGSSKTQTTSQVLGPALTLPYTEDFSSWPTHFDHWMAYDGNADNNTWIYNFGYGPYEFGNETNCREYVINNYGLTVTTEDADEWLISPPLEFEAGKTYQLRLKARCKSDENLKITLGDRNTIAAQTTALGSLTIKPTTTTKWPIPFDEYTLTIPAQEAATTACLGLHLVTPYPASTGSSYLQISNIVIEEASETGISGVKTSKQGYVRVGNVLSFGDDVTRVELFDASGRQVYGVNAGSVDMTSLPEGLYIVVAKGSNGKSSYKVVR